MKNATTLIATLVAGTMFALPALAQAPAAPAPAAAPAARANVPPAFVVVIDMERLLRDCAAGKNRDTQLQTWANGVKNRDEADLKALNTEGETLQRSRATMAPEAWESKAKEFEERYNNRVNEVRSRQQELQMRGAYANKQIIDVADPLIAQVMSERGGNIALEMSATRSFFNGLDITTDVVARVNQKLTTVSIELPRKPATPAPAPAAK